MTNRKAELCPDDDAPAHRTGCWVVIGNVDRNGVPRRLLVRGGGWSCPGCANDKLAQLRADLDHVTSRRKILWYGELDDPARSAASRLARKRRHSGRLTITRVDAPALVLSDTNLTPRTRRLSPHRTPVAVELILYDLEDGPLVRRLRFAGSWLVDPDIRPHRGGCRFGVSAPEVIDKAIRAAGFEPDEPTGLDPPVAAARIASELDDLRSGHEPGTDKWGRPIPKPHGNPVTPPAV
ncbi:MAG: hypothetical protein ACODAG_12615 [Myxococcota bacterium]